MNRQQFVNQEILHAARIAAAAVAILCAVLTAPVQAQQVTNERAAGGAVQVDEEHQVWPFDGEYWRDELGFYRQQVTSQCGR